MTTAFEIGYNLGLTKQAGAFEIGIHEELMAALHDPRSLEIMSAAEKKKKRARIV